MSVSTVHVLHGLLLPSGTFLSQLTDTTPAQGIEELIGMAAGHPQPLFTGVMAVRPDVTFNSQQIKTILDACGLFGSDLSSGNTDLYYKKAQDLGVRVPNATLDHLRLRIAQGYLYWKSIRAQQRQTAEIACRLIPTYDGTNAPVVPAGGVALAGTSTAAEYFTLGPVKLNGSFLPGVKEWTLDLGLQTIEEDADGDLYNTFAGVGELQNVVLTARGLDATAWTSIGAFLAISSLSFWLRKKTPDGGTYADGSASHIKIDAGGGLVYVPQSSSGGNRPVDNELKFLLRATSSTTNVLTLTTATAIA